MKHLKKRLFCCVLALLAAAAFSQEAKNALLIANGDYAKGIETLTNPVPEGIGLKTALESIGFSVTLVQNADLETMRKALKAFKKKSEEVKGISFFHYGGHAVQMSGANYLIPVDAQIEDDDEEEDVQVKLLNVDRILDSMVGEANIIILDSCRNNPFGHGKKRGVSDTRGLAVTGGGSIKSKNYMIVYSAAAGQTAKDGLFTPILTKKITEKNKNFAEILTDIRNEVDKATNGKQAAFEYNGLKTKVYLAGIPTNVTASTGRINIFSGIAGDVYIDNAKKGTIKEDGELSVELPNGSYTIEIRSEITTWKRTVKVDSNKTTHIRVETGNILLSSDIAGEVYIDGRKYREEIKEKIPLSIKKLPAGKYTIEIRNGTASFKKEVLVTEQHDEAVYIAKSNAAEAKSKTIAAQTSSKSGKNVIGKPDKYTKQTPTTPPKYSFGVYGGYSLSHFAAAPFSFTGHGMSFGILPLQKTFGIFDLKTAIGYAFAYKSIKNDTLIYHELDVISVKAGLKFAGVSFHIGLGVPVIWEVVKHKSAGSGTLTRFAISTPIDIQYAFNNYIALYAEYAPAFPVGNRGIPLVKHSFNIGVAANIFHLY